MTACRIDAGGRYLSATCAGQGSPLVVLENGFIAESDSWKAVAEGISEFTRVCVYDRAGRGSSDPAPKPRNAADLVADLRAVVHSPEVGAKGKVILVGQSFGGLLVRLYAQRHPGEVAGLVLVDSMHEDQFEAMGPSFPDYRDGEPAMLTGMRAFWREGWRHPEDN
ncbi:MAG: alpha/beta fold hydrolase, partial [Spirochaetota bacterium]